MSWIICVVGHPKSQARPRTFWHKQANRPVTWSKKTTWFELVYTEALKNRPRIPFEGPLMAELTFRMPKPKSKPKKAKWHITKPDEDNLKAAVYNALTQAHVWRDDCLVCKSTFQKIYSEDGSPAGITISVRGLKG